MLKMINNKANLQEIKGIDAMNDSYKLCPRISSVTSKTETYALLVCSLFFFSTAYFLACSKLLVV